MSIDHHNNVYYQTCTGNSTIYIIIHTVVIVLWCLYVINTTITMRAVY